MDHFHSSGIWQGLLLRTDTKTTRVMLRLDDVSKIYKHHHDFSCLHIWKCLCDQLEKKDDVCFDFLYVFLREGNLTENRHTRARTKYLFRGYLS